MSIFVTSDHHFGHANVIEMCKRPFQSIEHMDQILIENWNTWVKPDDTVYYLGDFCLAGEDKAKYYFSHLNGQITFLVNKTHHDKNWLKPYLNVKNRIMAKFHPVTMVQPVLRLNHEHHVFILCHFPFGEWENQWHGSIHLHGHTHGHYPGDNKINCFDVGVDMQGYTPAPLEDFIPYAEQAEAYSVEDIDKIVKRN